MQTRRIDPVVEEIRAIRDKRAARLGYDVAAIFRDIREMQDVSDAEYVRLSGRTVASGFQSGVTK